MSRLKDRIAVVSGAAAGIGRAAAIRLAAEGAKIEILDIKNASEVCEEIRAADGVANSSICDVTNEAQIAEAVKVIEQRHGRVDILVNNAGILSGRTPWHQLTYDEINRFVQINYIGYFLVSKAVYPLLKKSQCGRVINVASRTYFLANPGQMAYVAAKGAVMGHDGPFQRGGLQPRHAESGYQEAGQAGAPGRADRVSRQRRRRVDHRADDSL
jgi:NAD(P)-dependent dehydrogenase (short-subunit alcohol dehydrogenase family)